MHDPGAYPRPERSALDAENQSMLRAMLLCELIEQIDRAAATSRLGSARANRPGLAPALRRMTQIRDALDRLDEGTYGICDTCHHQIPFVELKAAPAMSACTACRPAPAAVATFTTVRAHHIGRMGGGRRTGETL